MLLNQWAIKYGISVEALTELNDLLAGKTKEVEISETDQYSEARVQTEIRLEASKKGCRLWRNNVGALSNPHTGQLVRYGLCNESARMNQTFKSSDLIGIRPVVINADMVGCTLGQFVAREVKKSGWQYSGQGREVAQLRFIQLVNGLGGDAAFANSVGTL